MDLNHVNESAVDNYRELRKRMGVVAGAFPVVVIIVGWLWGMSLQPTLSDYYFAHDPTGNHRVDVVPVRLWFCGFLFAVGIFLFRYRGFSKNEDRWLSLAGTFAVCVAIFPMSQDGRNDYDWVVAWTGLAQLSVHGIVAVLAFACIAVVIFWYSDSTLSELRKHDPAAAKKYKTIYFAIGVYMAVAIGLSVALHMLNKKHGSFILFAEWSGIWAFALYWYFKNQELALVGRMLGKPAGKVARPAGEIAEML